MKIGLNIAGALLVILGGIWFLQGILPGSIMTGADPVGRHWSDRYRRRNRSADCCQSEAVGRKPIAVRTVS